MLTKSSSELTLFDTLSRLTFTRAARLLGPKGNRLIATGGKFDIDLTTQVKFDRGMFRLTVDGAAVTLTLSPVARHRLEWRCDACEVPCEHAGAAFSLILEEKLALGLAGAPPARAPAESVSEEALVAQALAERAERARTEKMRLTSLDSQEIWTDYTLTNAASGKSYRVALRGWQPGQSYCSCRISVRTRSAPANISSMRSKQSEDDSRTRSAIDRIGAGTSVCTCHMGRSWNCVSCCHPTSMK
jgi:hypothetical protein